MTGNDDRRWPRRLVGAALALGIAATIACGPAANASAEAGGVAIRERAHVELRLTEQRGATRTYVALVERDGAAVDDAVLDIGALTGDPDLRVRTTRMDRVIGRPGRYRATIAFPANGSWVVTVRSGGTLDQVDLFDAKVTTAVSTTTHEDSPSRRALRTIDPTFTARYDPSRLTPGEPLTPSEAAAATTHSGAAPHGTPAAHEDPASFDAPAFLWGLVHLLGVLAWFTSVLGLVIANRVGPGPARAVLGGWVAEHYGVLAVGGLVTALLSGLELTKAGPLGRDGIAALAGSRLGMTYVVAYALKVALVATAVVTSARVGVTVRRLPAPAWRLRPAGATPNDADAARVLRLAEANAALTAAIVVCVAVLNNVHHALH